MVLVVVALPKTNVDSVNIKRLPPIMLVEMLTFFRCTDFIIHPNEITWVATLSVLLDCSLSGNPLTIGVWPTTWRNYWRWNFDLSCNLRRFLAFLPDLTVIGFCGHKSNPYYNKVGRCENSLESFHEPRSVFFSVFNPFSSDDVVDKRAIVYTLPARSAYR